MDHVQTQVVLHSQVGRINTEPLNVEHRAAEPILTLVSGSATTGRMTLDSGVDLFLARIFSSLTLS